MSNTATMMPLGRVLLGATGEGQDWSVLRDHLVGIGWQVDLFDPTPRHDPAEAEAALPLLEGVDLAVLMTPASASGDDQVSNRLVYLTGILQGALGSRRVLSLVANDAANLTTGSSVAELRYEPGDIRSRFPLVDSLLADLRAQSSGSFLAPWLERFGVVDGRVAPEVLLVLGAVAVVAAFAGILGYQFFGGSTNELSAELAEEATLASGDLAEQDPGSVPDGAVVLGPQVSGGLGSDIDGMVGQLPARCVIETESGLLLPEVIVCEGVGGLTVDGHPGPWHSTIHQVLADIGVVGDVVLGTPDSGDGGRIDVEPGTEQQLDSADSTVGIQRLELFFSANGQQVVLKQTEADGGQVVTFTYGLGFG
ncbi:MAG: hypothetical protein GY773_11770 [Actinomycetia bacterium]|nr:hypothetical protein [Actinomycetes bacterium]